MNLFKRKKDVASLQTVVRSADETYYYSRGNEHALYRSLRENIPIIDAAFSKTVRLIGGFRLHAKSPRAQALLDDFCMNVPVGCGGVGLESFVCRFFENLLLYGDAVGEIAIAPVSNKVSGLYVANLDNVVLRPSPDNLSTEFFVKTDSFEVVKAKHQHLLFHCALNPEPDSVYGTSLLKGLPFVCSILSNIFNCMDTNFKRIGNVRYSVNYKPSSDMNDKILAKERAVAIAKEWQQGMQQSKDGQVTDFVSVGDVSIKVIGADNQFIDTQVPIKQILEQIVSKLSIPPFLLGLSWSTTERMSTQQSDMLTSELEFYRRLLTPIMLKIAITFLRLNGISETPTIEWDVINLQDDLQQAQADYLKAQTLALNSQTYASYGESSAV